MKLLALLLSALVLAGPALAGPPSEANLETELVCPVCHETLDQSTAPVAVQMKAEIRRRIAQGWTKQQILDEMVANYGPGVLSTPSKHGFDLVAWVVPVGGAAAAVVAVAVGAVVWSRGRGEGPSGGGAPALDAETERRIDEELARFDA
ncbi:MAG: cytochrome c-type biogenesis protein CcmH [Actinobacteria bacterium]|nr:cytochrome c-type biogenesis protein CcmH [Actinomycetota bacterium]